MGIVENVEIKVKITTEKKRYEGEFDNIEALNRWVLETLAEISTE